MKRRAPRVRSKVNRKPRTKLSRRISPRIQAKSALPAADLDVLIAGGGLVGASLAAALAPLPLKLGVVEAVPFGKAGQPSYDDRVTALSLGSQRILEHLGVWAMLADEATPIQAVHVSERGRFAKTRLHAEELGVGALGYVLPNRAIGAALTGFLAQQPNLTMLAPAKVTAVNLQPQHAVVTVASEGEREVTARLLIAADGAQSEIRKQLGIQARVWDYGQSALICNLSVERPQTGCACERFTEQGTAALLPMGGERYAFIWTAERTHIEELLTLPEAEFLETAAMLFNGRFGRFFKLGKRQSYPLSQVQANRQVHGRVVVLGNAAHSLSPIGAQGFNLSLRDVAALAEMLAHTIEGGVDVGDESLFPDYTKSRRRDQSGTAVFTDLLTRIFSNPLSSVGMARDSGLLGLELLPSLRRAFLRRSAGLIQRRPHTVHDPAVS